ncbi:hypothetical protein BJ742DRAFT_286713 [Cladochytrium replicatum]|nr:hypothetical protein BJ742DRAFT_286713 [Cladochytrium replicatum]
MLSHDMTPVDPIAFDSRFSKLPGIRYQLDSASITQPATTSSKVVDHRRKYLISVPEPSIAKPPKGSSMKRDCVLGHGQNLDGSKLDYVEPVPREAREIPSESIHLPVYLGGHNPEPRGIPKPPVVKTFFSDWAEVEKKNNHLKRELADFEIKQKLEIAEHKRHEEELEKINSRSYTWPFEGRFSSPKPPNKAVHRHSTKNAEYAEQLRRQVQERRNAHEASEKEDQRLQQAHIESDYFKPQLVYRRQFRKEVDQRSPDVFIDPISGRVIARETKKADHRHRQVMQAHADSRGESQRARPFRDPFKHASPEIERSKLIYRRLLDEQLAIREKIREEERTQAVQVCD